MIRIREMPYPSIHRLIRIPRPLGSKLPYRPVLGVFLVEVFDEGGEGVAVVGLGVGARGAGGGDEGVGYVAEVEVGVLVGGAGAGYEAAEERGLLVVLGRLI